MRENIFFNDLEKTIFKKEFEKVLYFSSIFEFEGFRDIVKLLKCTKEIINVNLLIHNVFLLDLILIEWLKYKHPLIWEILTRKNKLFLYKKDISKLLLYPELSEPIDDSTISISFGDENLKKEISSFIQKVHKIKELGPSLFGDEIEAKRIIEIIFYLINIEFSRYQPDTLVYSKEILKIILKDFEKSFKIKPSIYLLYSDLDEYFIERLENKIIFKNQYMKSILNFKRLFRLHNFKIYLGLKNYLIKIDDKEFYTLHEIIDYFTNNRNAFEVKIINDYTKELYKIPDGNLISIRNPLLEEILINIISYIDPNYLRIIRDIYKKIEDEIEKEKGKIGIKNAEAAKESIKGIYNDLQQVEEYFKQLN
jgi:hypothetical protein